uniref:Uncharacterized protein n=1 Tax=Arundo donax TaxID=35708 RepID=A0A0A9GMF5_ARUDO
MNQIRGNLIGLGHAEKELFSFVNQSSVSAGCENTNEGHLIWSLQNLNHSMKHINSLFPITIHRKTKYDSSPSKLISGAHIFEYKQCSLNASTLRIHVDECIAYKNIHLDPMPAHVNPCPFSHLQST